MLRLTQVLLVLTCVLSAGHALAFNAEADLQQRLESARGELGAPGALLLVKLPDGSLHSAVSGLASIEEQRAVSLDERFRIGSITKTFVAVLSLKLMEQGLFSLDDKVITYIPELPGLLPNVPQAAEITVRDLLQHSSGLKDYVDVLIALPPPVQQRAAALPWTPQEVVTIIYRDEPLFAPGAGCDYSSTNFILLGMLIERASGREIGSLLRSEIIDPLQLEDTFFAATETVEGGQASGYVLDYSGLVDVTALDRTDVAWATGSILSDADDLLDFASALFEGELLTDGQREQMMDWRAMYEGEDYGLGLSRYHGERGTAMGHGGATLAYRAQMVYFPEHDFYVIAFNNLGQSRLSAITSVGVDWAMQQIAAGIAPVATGSAD